MSVNRTEVSQKAAEVDVLNDQLTEERKRSRDLQWTMEKEKCRSGRTEESKREELEVRALRWFRQFSCPVICTEVYLRVFPFSSKDLQLSLEEQRSHVAQLTLSLEQERQASSQLSDQAEQERLSLRRRLQELQVQLETEQAKSLEMSAALGRERELRTGVSTDSTPSDEAEEEKRRLEEEGGLLERMQRELDDKHTQAGFFCAFILASCFYNSTREKLTSVSSLGGAPPQSGGGTEARGGT